MPEIDDLPPTTVRRRFRLALIGYVILATVVVAGLAVNYAQQQDIKDSQNQIIKTATVLIQRDCNIVVGTANVFVDFIRKEIALRRARAADPQVSEAVRAFDRAEVSFWTQRTLPMLVKAFAIHCGDFKVHK
jgi:hypothetical protein